MSAANVKVTIKTASSSSVDQTVDCDLTWRVADLKEKLSILYKVPVSKQRLIYVGHVLKDSSPLSDVFGSSKLSNTQTMHLVWNSLNESLGESKTKFDKASKNNHCFLNQDHYVSICEKMYNEHRASFQEYCANHAIDCSNFLPSPYSFVKSASHPETNTESTEPPPVQEVNPPQEQPAENERHDAQNTVLLSIFKMVVFLSFVYFYSSFYKFVLISLSMLFYVIYRSYFYFDMTAFIRSWYHHILPTERQQPQQNPNDEQPPAESPFIAMLHTLWVALVSFFVSLFPAVQLHED